MTYEIRRPTGSEVDAFEADGVVVLRNAISPGAIDELERSIESLASNLASSPAGYDLENLADAAWSDREHIDYGHDHPRLIGSPSLRVYDDGRTVRSPLFAFLRQLQREVGSRREDPYAHQHQR